MSIEELRLTQGSSGSGVAGQGSNDGGGGKGTLLQVVDDSRPGSGGEWVSDGGPRGDDGGQRSGGNDLREISRGGGDFLDVGGSDGRT